MKQHHACSVTGYLSQSVKTAAASPVSPMVRNVGYVERVSVMYAQPPKESSQEDFTVLGIGRFKASNPEAYLL